MVDKKTNSAPASPPTALPSTPPVSGHGAVLPPHCEPCPPQLRLDAPLRWRSANALEQKMLENLQGNILKGHGRDHTTHLFFNFGSDHATSKRVLRELGNYYVTSAYKQLISTDAFKKGIDGGTFCAAFLSATGYEHLGLAFVAPSGNAAFKPGMRSASSLADTGDKAVTAWDTGLRGRVDGMVLVADDETGRGSTIATTIELMLKQAGCTVVHKQAGKAIRNAAGNGLEHFGYVDGRSQPLMLLEDVESESRDEGIVNWDPTASLDKALVADPLVTDPDKFAFGSFFVFRKLEQHVRLFKTREQKLANALGLTGEDRERAGALVVGRFEDGTPVTLADEAKGQKAPKNDFDYAADAAGARCPFHAHIRKTNPRGSGGFGVPEKTEQLHIMARRGITYEDVPRDVHPDALPDAKDEAAFEADVKPLLPEGRLGLLFMAYNAKLDEQFVFTQKQWANATGFPQAPAAPGLDGVIGQSDATPGGQVYPKHWDEPTGATAPFDFKGFVQMRGGEYFFAPSLRFLRSL